ncbi:MAG: hypothetical protein V8Q84_03275 [Bilophila sp.]
MAAQTGFRRGPPERKRVGASCRLGPSAAIVYPNICKGFQCDQRACISLCTRCRPRPV